MSGIKECYRAVLLDASVSPSKLFGTAVETVVDRFREMRKQSDTFGKFIPCRVQAPTKSSAPPPGINSWREKQKTCVAARTPPPRSGEQRRHNRRKPHTDLRAVCMVKKKEESD